MCNKAREALFQINAMQNATVTCSKCQYPWMDLFDTEQRVGYAAAAFLCPNCGLLVFFGDASDLFVQAIESEVAKLKQPRR